MFYKDDSDNIIFDIMPCKNYVTVHFDTDSIHLCY